jgi:hypothetical protein
MNSRFRDRLARLADGAVPQPDIPAMERLTRRRQVRRRVGAAIAVPVIALAVVLPVGALMQLGNDVVGSPSGPGDRDQPTAESIMENGGPVGKELADALGLELLPRFKGDCSFYVEINDSHEGYCLEGLEGDDHARQWVIGQALRGRIVTDAELAKVEDTLG